MIKWNDQKINRITIIVFVVFVLFVFVWVFFKKSQNSFDDGDFFEADGEVARNDDFFGPFSGDHLNDRDGVFDSLAVSPSDPDVVFVGTENNALFKSVDGGETWKWIRNGFWHNKRSYPEFYDIAIDSSDENLMYAALTNGPQSPDVESAAGFYYSADKGESWERSIEGLPNTAINSVELFKDSPERIIIGLDGEESTNYQMRDKERPVGGIYLSNDKGKTWRTTFIEGGEYNRYSRIVARVDAVYATGHKFKGESPGKPRMIDLENSLGLIKSEDKGETWKSISPSGTFPYYFDVSKDGNVIYFSDGVSGNGYRSIDGGESWERAGVSFSNVIRISPYRLNVAIFANGKELFKTQDGLLSQKKVFEIKGEGGFDDIEFTSDPNVIYAAGDGYRVYKSTDGGDTFSQIANLREFIENQRE